MPHDDVADQLSVIMAWACWSVPLMGMEVALQLRAMRPARKPATVRPPARVVELSQAA